MSQQQQQQQQPAAAAAQPAGATSPSGSNGAAAVANGSASKHENASLYVGDLSADVTEAILYDVFKNVGQVASIRVCRHAVTRVSLGYAYVNFVTPADAERALETLKYTPIKDRPIRIMWSNRDPTLRKDAVANVFIKNLHKDIDEGQLHESFSQFGEILSCKIAREDDGVSRGHGFVQFKRQEDADLAIKHANGLKLHDMEIYVALFQPSRERQEKYTNLYVKLVPKAWSDDDLKKYFEKIGPVSSAVVMREEGGASKGFGFVNYTEPEHATRATEVLHNKVPEGGDEALYVGRAMKKPEREKVLKSQRSELTSKFQGVNLYIKNLDDSVDDKRLEEIFKGYGTIASAHVMRNDKGVSKGFGFVCFGSPDEAQKALHEMQGKIVISKPLYVAFHEPKEARKAKLEAQHQARSLQRVPMLGSGMFPGQPMGYFPGMPQRQPFMFPQGGMPIHRGAPRGPPFNGMPPAAGMQVQPGQPGPIRRGPNGPGGPSVSRGRGAQPSRGGARGGARGGYGGHGKGASRGDHAGGAAAAAGSAPGSHPALNAAQLAQMSEEERRIVLGNALFSAVSPKNPSNAGKIVGMLLEGMDPSEIIAVLENESALDDKIQEAVETLGAASSEATPAQN